MTKNYASLRELLENELSTDEDPKTKKLIQKLKDVEKRGYFTKSEFLEMCMWKSPRKKPDYIKNSPTKVKDVSTKVFSTNYDKRKIKLLTSLEGVQIPVASAILMLTNPKKYGVIDIRVWQVLYDLGSVSVNPLGKNFKFNNWYQYLMKIRYYAKEFNVKARDIERTLFYYHTKTYPKGLYK